MSIPPPGFPCGVRLAVDVLGILEQPVPKEPLKVPDGDGLFSEKCEVFLPGAFVEYPVWEQDCAR